MDNALLFLMQHGALVLFVVVFIEQIGLPFPAVPLLTAAGALAGTGHMSLSTAIGSTVLAAVLADWIWYEMGRRRGRTVLGWLCRISLEPDSCVRRTEAFFVQHGPQALVLAKFIPGFSTIAPPLAGIVGLGIPLFLLYDGLGAMLWAGSSVVLGYLFSDRIEQALMYGDHVGPVMILAAGAAVAAYVGVKAVVRRRQLQRVPRITAGELAKRLTTDEPPVLIDVRARAASLEDAGLPGAQRMPIDELARRAPNLSQDRDLVLYCACPQDVTSAQGALLLRRMGFERVWVLNGGMAAWQAYEEGQRSGALMPIAALTQ
jgi:membrane protein DedA with SNARE-associated domain/rhodanese-related sulfurtransferase